MTVLDPRERVIKAGNDLLDAIYDYELICPELDAAKERLESNRPYAEGEARTTAELVIRFMTAQAARRDALKQYLTVRGLVEQFDAATTRGTA